VTTAQETLTTLESLAFAAAVFEQTEGIPDTENSDLHIPGTQTLPTKEPFLCYPTQEYEVHTERPEGYASSALAADESHLSAQTRDQQILRFSNAAPQQRSNVRPYDSASVQEVNEDTHTTRADQALSSQAVGSYEDDDISSNESVSL